MPNIMGITRPNPWCTYERNILIDNNSTMTDVGCVRRRSGETSE